MKKTMMKKQNWILLISGVAATYIGFLLSLPITTNYDGFYAFFTISVIVLGLALAILGLSLRFEKERDQAE